jgi:polysaccharide pyruvyl transferase WcaK-like protein
MVDVHDEDLSLAHRLRRAVPSLKVLNAFRAPSEGIEPWALACGATALARIVVGVRYHTAVFRLMAGRRAFVAYYSQKGRDLVERLGQPGCAIDALDAEAQLGAIEASAETAFDIASIRQRVRADFRSALAAALPAAAAFSTSARPEEARP